MPFRKWLPFLQCFGSRLQIVDLEETSKRPQKWSHFCSASESSISKLFNLEKEIYEVLRMKPGWRMA